MLSESIPKKIFIMGFSFKVSRCNLCVGINEISCIHNRKTT